MDWYALFVETSKEDYVHQHLCLNFDKSVLNSIVPKRRLTERKAGKVHHVLKNLFPGYVLLNTQMNNNIYSKVTSVPRVIKILSSGSCYTRIEEKEIIPILKLVGDEGILDYSKIYLENSRVIVKSGPLKGMEGIINKLDSRKNRAKIVVDFLNTSRLIDVGIEILDRIDN